MSGDDIISKILRWYYDESVKHALTDNDHIFHEAVKATSDYEKIKASLKVLTKGLRFYAKPEHWKPEFNAKAASDKGHVARTILRALNVTE